MVAIKLLKWLVLAINFLTVIPTFRLSNVEDEDLRRSIVFFPAVGLLLGAIAWLVERLTGPIFGREIAAFMAIVALTLLTGLLHLDGVMDLGDALGSRKPREQALEIMKDSHVGAIGAGLGMLVLLGKWVALKKLAMVHMELFLLPPLYSRLGMIWIMAISPSARNGIGLSGFYAQKIPVLSLIVASVYSLGLALWWLPFSHFLIDTGLLVLGIACYHLWMMRKFGGMTGDLYGAFNEGMEWFLWTLGAIS